MPVVRLQEVHRILLGLSLSNTIQPYPTTNSRTKARPTHLATNRPLFCPACRRFRTTRMIPCAVSTADSTREYLNNVTASFDI